MTRAEIDDIRDFIRGEEMSDSDVEMDVTMSVEMDVTMSNDRIYHVDAYSTHCFAEEGEEGDDVFLVIHSKNSLKYLSLEHILAVEVILK